MKISRVGLSLLIGAVAVASFSFVSAPASSSTSPQVPTWWDKAQFMLSSPPDPTCTVPGDNFSEGNNVDMSNELTPQSETSIAINPSTPSQIVGGSNEIFCLPMRGYWSITGGTSGSWHDVNLPLPPAITTNGQDFGSDPGVAWDTLGNVYYVYIVVFFNRTFHSIQGTEMAVARSSDHGQTWTATFFNQNSGTGRFNDKPMITVDTNPSSPHFNTIYAAWDNASARNGKSSDNDVILVSSSTDHGVSFSEPVAASPSQGGQAAVIGADPFVGADGTLFVAWNDAINPAIRVSSSSNGGGSFGPAHLISSTLGVFQVLPPAQALRGALIYPACSADSSSGPHRGRLYCSWSDATAADGMRVFESQSDNGTSWSTARRVDNPTGVLDQFNQWLATDPTTGAVVLSWNDSREDPTRAATNIFFASSTDGGATFIGNTKLTNAPTNETLVGADFGNQYGDYEGIAAFGGEAHSIWTDRRARIPDVPNLDEETFTEAVAI